eukprot:3435311-Prymnesium_polylepis.1
MRLRAACRRRQPVSDVAGDACADRVHESSICDACSPELILGICLCSFCIILLGLSRATHVSPATGGLRCRRRRVC